ncbi:helix-turn-helix transcriptional regulator [Streptomyces sp. NPDC047108]|uniref:helix-turn-helix transcriptional regulator n=1 Tax=Streptomyces sp. NPDC047108 TaxID=3155025 RepID=UPI0033E4F67E
MDGADDTRGADGSYEEWHSRPTGAVLWTRTADDGPHRVLPDGCTDLIWLDGELIVAGPDTHGYVPAAVPGAHYAGLRFPPGRGPDFLGVPADELRDLRVPLGAIWPGAQVRRLAESVADAADRTAALERIAVDRLAETPRPDPRLAVVVAGLRAGEPVSAVAAGAGLGERQLHRRALAAFGYGPKTLARVLRMNRALDLARSGTPFAEVAVDTGYADQAHLAREVKALAGVPLRELLV